MLEHHGRVANLIICKGAFTEANELADEMKTLKGYGIKGAPREVDPPVTVPLFYDFKPVAYDEPLLLVRLCMGAKLFYCAVERKYFHHHTCADVALLAHHMHSSRYQ